MPQFTCPNCKQHSVSLTQKLFLNATVPSACKNCGSLLTTTILWNAVSASPLIAFVVWNLAGDHPAVVEISALVVAVAISALAHMLVSPIQAKAVSDAPQ